MPSGMQGRGVENMACARVCRGGDGRSLRDVGKCIGRTAERTESVA